LELSTRPNVPLLAVSRRQPHPLDNPPRADGTGAPERSIRGSPRLAASTFGTDLASSIVGVVRVLTGCSSLLLVAVAAAGCSAAPSSVPALRSTTTTGLSPTPTAEASSTTTTLFSIEPCGGTTSGSDIHPDVDNQTLLLTHAAGPPDYTYGAPQVASGPKVIASVPSYSPAVYESFQVPARNGGWSGQEVIGEVSSTDVASQLA
jgi:hypothetical protein